MSFRYVQVCASYWSSTSRPVCQCAVRPKLSNFISFLALGKRLFLKDATWSPTRYLRQFHCSILQVKENILLVMSKWKTCFPTRLSCYISNVQISINGRNKVFIKNATKSKKQTVSIARNKKLSTKQLNFKEAINPAHSTAFPAFFVCQRYICLVNTSKINTNAVEKTDKWRENMSISN